MFKVNSIMTDKDQVNTYSAHFRIPREFWNNHSLGEAGAVS